MNDQTDLFSADFFIRYFEAIPDDKWCTGLFNKPGGKHCALGHCGVREGSGYIEYSTMANALEALLRNHFSVGPVYFNDSENGMFKLPTPKARILAALYKIKSKQTPTLSTPALVVQAGWPTVTMGSVKVGEVRV